jgi:hypothetical protein
VEPVRVKVYGLFSRTRRRYLIEATIGAVFGSALFVAWWLGWSSLRQHLTAHDLPPALRFIVVVLDRAPWILLGAALIKGMEVFLVLRSFARREALNRQKELSTPPDPG